MTGDNTDTKPGSSAVDTGKHPPQMFTLGGNSERWSARFCAYMCAQCASGVGDRVDLLCLSLLDDRTYDMLKDVVLQEAQ